jgi:pimeloyl-ACP methyl ester carboxylesterase
MGDYAHVNGQDLYYEVYGPGPGPGPGPAAADRPPLVLLHGGLVTTEMTFGPLIPALAEDQRVIGVELQGHGHTTDTERPMRIEYLVDDVVALLDHLDLAQVNIFGFSLGGIVALTLALRHPARAARLIIASVNYRPDGADSELGPDRLPTEADFQAMRDAHAAVAPDPTQFDRAGAKTSAMVQALPGWSDDELRSLAAPTLLIFGDTDFAPLPHAVGMHALLPRAQLAVLPGATHMAVTRRPEVVLPIVRRFLSEGP